ncbi:MAG: hypothetical protein R6V29_10775 [Spirochaetia bacterium]
MRKGFVLLLILLVVGPFIGTVAASGVPEEQLQRKVGFTAQRLFRGAGRAAGR